MLFLGLMAVSALLVHASSYEPAVSFVPLYLAAAAGGAGAITLLLLPPEMFTDDFCAGAYTFYAALVAVVTFLSGGISSELYLLFLPLLLAVALHGSFRLGAVTLLVILVSYLLAAVPDLLGGGTNGDAPAPLFFRLAVFGLVGILSLAAARGVPDEDLFEEYVEDEDGSVMLEMVAGEISTRPGEPVSVVLVDPGREVGNVDLLVERVRARISEPVLLGEGTVFGLVLGGEDANSVEAVARRALAVAGSLGARETRAGAAVYPQDARSTEDLLILAGQALEAACAAESPSAVVLVEHIQERRHRAAR